MTLQQVVTSRSHWALFAVIAFVVLLAAAPGIAEQPHYEGHLELSYKTGADGNHHLEATATATVDDDELPVESLTVAFFAEEPPEAPPVEQSDDAEGEEEDADGEDDDPAAEPEPTLNSLGEVDTDEEGIAALVVDADDREVVMGDDGFLHFSARVEHDQLGELTADKSLQQGRLELSLLEEEPEQQDDEEETDDSDDGESVDQEDDDEPIRSIEATFERVLGDDAEPVGMAEVQFYVIRQFGDIGFHGDFTMTDGDGVVAEEFPSGMTGDEEGGVQVEVRVEDHEDIGTVVATIDVPWGEEVDDSRPERALWAGRDAAPLWLLIVANTMLVGGWAAIVYVMWLVVRIRRRDDDE